MKKVSNKLGPSQISSISKLPVDVLEQEIRLLHIHINESKEESKNLKKLIEEEKDISETHKKLLGIDL